MKFLKIFFSEAESPSALIFDLLHDLMYVYKSCSNYVARLTYAPAQVA